MPLRFLILLAAFVAAGARLAASSLSDAPSAFLRAHADSPVQWMNWGEAAFARAKAENKPIYLVIGTATNELSRAMRQQSFAREENARMLNEHFVCVLADRDDQPALAALAQDYLSTVKQTRGWPVNLWLTPELKPFEGATYLPPSDEWGKEGFPNALKRVLAAWQSDAGAQQTKGEEAVAAQEAARAMEPAPAIEPATARQTIADSLVGTMALFDATHGGFGDPPKHPQPELLHVLLQGDAAQRDAALQTLRAIRDGAVHDPLDGGFFRYASDAEWKLPYLQKTLTDQARLALAFLEAAKVDGDAGFATAARDALRYALTLRDDTGAYRAAEDGTLEAVMPSFIWTRQEIEKVLGRDAAAFCAAYGVTAEGNLAADALLGVETAGRNMLYRVTPRGEADAETALAAAAAKLLEHRRSRPQPVRDDPATAGAHGLLLAALTRAGADLNDAGCKQAAIELAEFIRTQLVTPEGALRSRPGRETLALARDYALVVDGLLAHAATSGDATAGELAHALLAKADALFWDETAQRYFAAPEPLPPGLWARVHAPAPDASDLPGTEPAMLLTLLGHDLGDAARRAALAATIVQAINNSPDPARGDQLLALHVFGKTK